MSKNSVFCIAASRNEADQIVGRLKSANISNAEISVLLADGKNVQESPHKAPASSPQVAAVGVGTGALVGGALGWIAGIGVLAIPGVGPFLAAGQVMAVLSGAALGAAAGGIAGGLIALGMPEDEAKRYESQVKTGKVLISVHTDNSRDLTRARYIFKQTGAQNICSASEAYARSAPAAFEASGPAMSSLNASAR